MAVDDDCEKGFSYKKMLRKKKKTEKEMAINKVSYLEA